MVSDTLRMIFLSSATADFALAASGMASFAALTIIVRTPLPASSE